MSVNFSRNFSFAFILSLPCAYAMESDEIKNARAKADVTQYASTKKLETRIDANCFDAKVDPYVVSGKRLLDLLTEEGIVKPHGLEIGAGTGLFANLNLSALKEHNATLHCTDNSDAMVETLGKNLQSQNPRLALDPTVVTNYSKADAAKLSFSSSEPFDFAVAYSMVYEIRGKGEQTAADARNIAFGKLSEVVKDGCLMGFFTFNYEKQFKEVYDLVGEAAAKFGIEILNNNIRKAIAGFCSDGFGDDLPARQQLAQHFDVVEEHFYPSEIFWDIPKVVSYWNSLAVAQSFGLSNNAEFNQVLADSVKQHLEEKGTDKLRVSKEQGASLLYRM